MLRHTEVYSDITKAYGAIIRRNTCMYNCTIFRILVYLEPQASSKVCRTCKIIRQSQSSISKHFQRDLGIFRDTDAYSATLTGAQLGERGEASPAFFENRKNSSDFWKKGLDCVHFWVKFPI